MMQIFLGKIIMLKKSWSRNFSSVTQLTHMTPKSS
jgi:hypothetical protein